MSQDPWRDMVSLELDYPIWDRFFMPAPLAVIGSKEESGEWDLAPKHMVTALSWDNYFGFVCAPTHGTYSNIARERIFTVSFPRPDQVVMTSLTASPRWEDGSKVEVQAVPTIPARLVEGIFLRDSHLMLECELDRIVDDFGSNSLIAGKIIAAHVHEQALRADDRDDQEVINDSPMLVYLHPGRFTRISRSDSFPFPTGYRR
jgi:flavin reductase (DIM6/NTAB) family NADH-FMN oxidoreductase RutF